MAALAACATLITSFVANKETRHQALKSFEALQKKYGPVMRKVEYRGYVSRPDLGRASDS